MFALAKGRLTEDPHLHPGGIGIIRIVVLGSLGDGIEEVVGAFEKLDIALVHGQSSRK